MNLLPIKIGLIGAGRAGYGMHLPEVLAADGKFDFAALCDIDPARQEAFEKRLGHPVKFYSDVAGLVRDPEVELVSVATPSNFHTPHAVAALNAGKYVFIEKPIATSYAEALSLAEAAARHPGKLFLRHNRRFSPEIGIFREIIDSGILGEIFEIRFRIMSYCRRADWQAITECGGGLLNNWGPHMVEHALYFLDAPVKRIFSRLRKVAAAGNAEDHFNILLEGTNSRLIDLEVSGLAHWANRCIVFMEAGALAPAATVRRFTSNIWIRSICRDRLPRLRTRRHTTPLSANPKNCAGSRKRSLSNSRQAGGVPDGNTCMMQSVSENRIRLHWNRGWRSSKSLTRSREALHLNKLSRGEP